METQDIQISEDVTKEEHEEENVDNDYNEEVEEEFSPYKE